MLNIESLYYKRIICNDNTPINDSDMYLLTPKYIRENEKNAVINNLKNTNFLLIDAFCPIEEEIKLDFIDYIKNKNYCTSYLYYFLVRYQKTVAVQFNEVYDYLSSPSNPTYSLFIFLRFLLNHMPEQKEYIQKSIEVLNKRLETKKYKNIKHIIYLLNLSHLFPQHNTDESKLYFMRHCVKVATYYGIAHFPITLDFVHKHKNRIIDYNFVLYTNPTPQELQEYLELMQLSSMYATTKYDCFIQLQPNLEQMEKYLPTFKLQETFTIVDSRNICSWSNNNLKQVLKLL